MTTLIAEKAPLFVLSLASCVVTVLAQRSGGAIQQLQNVPISYRVSGALVSYAGYALSLVCPHRLAPYYPFQPEGPDSTLALASGIGLAAITILVGRLARRMPFLLVGWLWFVVTLLPVIGIRSDRWPGDGGPLHVCALGRSVRGDRVERGRAGSTMGGSRRILAGAGVLALAPRSACWHGVRPVCGATARRCSSTPFR
jgi:hypothetical protein